VSAQQGGLDAVIGKFFSNDEEAYRFILETSQKEQKELALALLPNGRSYVYPWYKNNKWGSPTDHAYGFKMKDMVAVVHTHVNDSKVSALTGDLGVSRNFGVPIYALGPNGMYWGAAIGNMRPHQSEQAAMTSDIVNGTGSFNIRNHATSLINILK
jgi:hypothetical protein